MFVSSAVHLKGNYFHSGDYNLPQTLVITLIIYACKSWSLYTDHTPSHISK